MKLIKFLALILGFLFSIQTYAVCERVNYSFEKPDEHIIFQRTAKDNPRGVVVLSHGGTSGGASRGVISQWGKFLKMHGFNVVMMSHYSSRGLIDRSCKANYNEAEDWRRIDTQNVLRWLAERYPEDAKRVVLMGFSAGAAAVFPFVTDSRFIDSIPKGVEVKAGLLFYPWQRSCIFPERDIKKPVLFVGAELDGTYQCWNKSNWLASAKSNQLFTFKVYEGANHAFDFEKLQGKLCEGGPYPYCMEYNEKARLTAEQDVLEYLKSLGL